MKKTTANKKGDKVKVNKNHHGASGSTGKILGVITRGKRTYYRVKLTSGSAAGFTMQFLQTELG